LAYCGEVGSPCLPGRVRASNGAKVVTNIALPLGVRISYLRAGWSVVPVPVEADVSPFQMYRPALGPNQPRIQYVLGSFSGVKHPVVITTHLHLVSRLISRI
jgi:hypothetical protein